MAFDVQQERRKQAKMKEPHVWKEADLLSLIQNGIKESINLDYKECNALQKTDGKKNELSKDVSAFANSAGGVLVYGIVENGHEPTGFDIGYDPTDITKEWIDQVITSNIQPRTRYGASGEGCLCG